MQFYVEHLSVLSVFVVLDFLEVYLYNSLIRKALLILVAICCTRFGLVCDTRYMVSMSDVHFHVMLKDVMVATTTTMKTYTETQKRDESSGDRGMEGLVFLTFHLGFLPFLPTS